MLPAETSDADRCSQSRTPKKRREEAFLRDVEISPWAVHESVAGRYCCGSRPIIARVPQILVPVPRTIGGTNVDRMARAPADPVSFRARLATLAP
jgi:hypothetical protein